MPLIQVYAYERSVEKRRELAKRITQATAEVYEVPEEAVLIHLLDLPRANTSHGGVLASDREAAPPQDK